MPDRRLLAPLALFAALALPACEDKDDQPADDGASDGADGASDGATDGADGASDGADGTDGADGASDGADGGPPLYWYSTCGDPSCGGYRGPTEGVPVCTTEAEGAPCAEAGAQCDMQTDCNTFFVCAAEDPKDQEGGCPRSAARFKHQIHRLDPAARAQAAAAALAVPLSTWRYTDQDPASPAHLGFIIEDLAPAGGHHPAVRPGGERVDLYGYTSLTLAAVQEQQAQLEALRAQNAALEERLDALEARCR
jgi:hypothetical protein